jgi:phosphomannomutase
MSGCLLGEYTISQIAEKQGLPADGALIKTIVTTNMADAIARNYNVKLIECLTGFKYIGQQILRFETEGKGTYLFGFEESYGCLIGTHARDKDAIVATMALCEAAAYYKSKGMNLWDAMVAMYDKYGYYKDDIQSIFHLIRIIGQCDKNRKFFTGKRNNLFLYIFAFLSIRTGNDNRNRFHFFFRHDSLLFSACSGGPDIPEG